ncbi:MAG TPA: hypothetical protein VFU35_05110 [Jatrophihabitans sp.]|nr:hypothetical protein [Jatrophihabitans sp.]
MANPSLAPTLGPLDYTDLPHAQNGRLAPCPPWCEIQTDRRAGLPHVAHRAAVWELPDRVELCVMQVVSEDPTDFVAAHQPTLYFWSADNAVFSDFECAEMADAIRRASEVLSAINGV